MTTTYDNAVDGQHATRCYGKYRGKITDNVDPLKQGRVKVNCPAVHVSNEAWAMPSSPYAGDKVGLFTVPPVGANVWVEFEAGDTDYPIVSGCFWAEKESPSSTGVAATKVLKSDCLTLTIDDTPGSAAVTVKVDTAAGSLTIVLDSSGITLTNGNSKVQLGTTSVSVNNGALEVV